MATKKNEAAGVDLQIEVERMLGEADISRKKVSVLVENDRDRYFWKMLIEYFVPILKGKVDFPYYSPNGSQGKGEILKYKSFVSDKLIICRDSDNEYLYKNDDTFGEGFIFKTYYYSIESHDCYPENLNELISKATNGSEYDMTNVLETYSRYTFNLLLYWLYFKGMNKHFEELSWKDWDSKVCKVKNALSMVNDMPKVNTNAEIDTALLNMRDRVDALLRNIDQLIEAEGWLESFKGDIEQLKEKLNNEHSLAETKTLFYISGHIAFEYVVKPLCEKIIEVLKRELQEKIENNQSIIQKMKDGMIAANKNIEIVSLSGNFEKCLRNPTLYPIMERIGTDLKNALMKK